MRGAGRGPKGTEQHQELWDSRTSFSLGRAVAGHLGLGGGGTSLLHKGGNRGGTGMESPGLVRGKMLQGRTFQN